VLPNASLGGCSNESDSKHSDSQSHQQIRDCIYVVSTMLNGRTSSILLNMGWDALEFATAMLAVTTSVVAVAFVLVMVLI
jgi:hypothetical protein